jgi:hypothetical protein
VEEQKKFKMFWLVVLHFISFQCRKQTCILSVLYVPLCGVSVG